jgi:hypothetical protein
MFFSLLRRLLRPNLSLNLADSLSLFAAAQRHSSQALGSVPLSLCFFLCSDWSFYLFCCLWGREGGGVPLSISWNRPSGRIIAENLSNRMRIWPRLKLNGLIKYRLPLRIRAPLTLSRLRSDHRRRWSVLFNGVSISFWTQWQFSRWTQLKRIVQSPRTEFNEFVDSSLCVIHFANGRISGNHGWQSSNHFADWGLFISAKGKLIKGHLFSSDWGIFWSLNSSADQMNSDLKSESGKVRTTTAINYRMSHSISIEQRDSSLSSTNHGMPWHFSSPCPIWCLSSLQSSDYSSFASPNLGRFLEAMTLVTLTLKKSIRNRYVHYPKKWLTFSGLSWRVNTFSANEEVQTKWDTLWRNLRKVTGSRPQRWDQALVCTCR